MTKHNDALRKPNLPPVADAEGDVWDGIAELRETERDLRWANGYPVAEGLFDISIEQIIRQARNAVLDEIEQRLEEIEASPYYYKIVADMRTGK